MFLVWCNLLIYFHCNIPLWDLYSQMMWVPLSNHLGVNLNILAKEKTNYPITSSSNLKDDGCILILLCYMCKKLCFPIFFDKHYAFRWLNVNLLINKDCSMEHQVVVSESPPGILLLSCLTKQLKSANTQRNSRNIFSCCLFIKESSHPPIWNPKTKSPTYLNQS